MTGGSKQDCSEIYRMSGWNSGIASQKRNNAATIVASRSGLGILLGRDDKK